MLTLVNAEPPIESSIKGSSRFDCSDFNFIAGSLGINLAGKHNHSDYSVWYTKSNCMYNAVSQAGTKCSTDLSVNKRCKICANKCSGKNLTKLALMCSRRTNLAQLNATCCLFHYMFS